jgi:hypothetical protein
VATFHWVRRIVTDVVGGALLYTAVLSTGTQIDCCTLARAHTGTEVASNHSCQPTAVGGG